MNDKRTLLPFPCISKLKSNILHFIFTPNLWISNDEGDFIEEIKSPTQNKKINDAVDKFILSSKFKYLVESILYGYKILYYYFENNLINIIVDTKNNLSIKELVDKLYDIDIDGNAPDLWMEGDISVTDNIELTPRIHKLFYLLGNTKKEIDLTKLPEIEKC